MMLFVALFLASVTNGYVKSYSGNGANLRDVPGTGGIDCGRCNSFCVNTQGYDVSGCQDVSCPHCKFGRRSTGPAPVDCGRCNSFCYNTHGHAGLSHCQDISCPHCKFGRSETGMVPPSRAEYFPSERRAIEDAHRSDKPGFECPSNGTDLEKCENDATCQWDHLQVMCRRPGRNVWSASRSVSAEGPRSGMCDLQECLEMHCGYCLMWSR